jgi:hypothetical protein
MSASDQISNNGGVWRNTWMLDILIGSTILRRFLCGLMAPTFTLDLECMKALLATAIALSIITNSRSISHKSTGVAARLRVYGLIIFVTMSTYKYRDHTLNGWLPCQPCGARSLWLTRAKPCNLAKCAMIVRRLFAGSSVRA